MGINLDEARAARREAEGKAPDPIVFGGQEFVMPVELPVEAINWMVRLADLSGKKNNGIAIKEALEGVIRGLLTDDDLGRFMSLKPSIEDLTAVVEGVPAEYGFEDVGESQASAPSSETTGTQSRPASKRTTASTRAKRSTAKSR